MKINNFGGNYKSHSLLFAYYLSLKPYPLFLELASEDEVELVPAINTNDGEPLDGEKDPVVVVLRLPGLGGNNRGDNGGGFGGFGGFGGGFPGFGGGAQDNGFPFSGKVFNL